MQHKFLRLSLIFILASSAFAQQKAADTNAPDAERLRAHIVYLASDKLEGRRTGTSGANMAAEYIAREFARAGLRRSVGVDLPGMSRLEADSPRRYMQEFPYVAGVELGKANAMTLTTRAVITSSTSSTSQTTPAATVAAAAATLDLRAGEDWLPLGFSANGRMENAPLTFVAYGISAPELNHDDYKNADVKDRIALAFASTPDGDNPHGQFARYADLRLRAAAARGAGARALVLIAEEENFKDDRLSRLAYDNAGGDAGLPVVVISRQAAAKILGLSGPPQLKEVKGKYPKWRAETTTPQGEEKRLREYDFLLESLKLMSHEALAISTDIVRKNEPASNVVGILEGRDPQLKNEVIVIGAHYDHLGRGGAGSLAAREGDIHHGADDNASGVAGLLELARMLSQERAGLRRTVVFIAFSGEEEGLIGSSYYVTHPMLPLERTVAMVNMDMVGRLKDNTLIIGGVGTAQEWKSLVAVANMSEGDKKSLTQLTDVPPGNSASPVKTKNRFALTLNEDGFGPSDHSSFYAKKIPVLFFFTGTHEDYHKPTDTPERINYEGEARVVAFVKEIVEDLEASDKRPTYTVAKSEGAGGRSASFRVYLGTVPNYGETTDGVKLDAVRENSPAEKAGLKAGDRIVKLAGRDVRNVYDYTYALAEMKAGQEYDVVILRAAQSLTLKITPLARKP